MGRSNNPEVKDHKGLVLNYWKRYLKQFNEYLRENCLLEDFSQEVEMISLEAKPYKTLKDSGKFIAKELREFLKKCGLRKRDGSWVATEFLHGEEWWETIFESGKTPDGLDTILFTMALGKNTGPQKSIVKH